MNLIKWFRKNNRKMMAIVVIFILVGFVGQAFFSQLSRRRAERRRTIAYFADNRKITNYDLALARQELETLKLLKADNMLRNISLPIFRIPDLHAAIMAELLFSDRTISPALSTYIKQITGANRYRISEKQINDIYRRSMPSEIYWLLLSNEAESAGVTTPNEVSRGQLAKTIPQFFNGATYSNVVGSIASQYGVSEEQILTAFGRLMTILVYARMICGSEDTTNSQMMSQISRRQETIDVEFVRFDSAVFAETQSEPGEEELIEQFDKYRKFSAGDINEQNPYGFGYKFDDMVQLEYIAVKLDDVSTTITAPTQEEAEDFYQNHREEFTESLSDPNDPNLPPTVRFRSYSEVAGIILKSLRREKINSQAEKILQEARTLTEAALQEIDMELAKISDEQFRQMAGDYKTAAEELSEKYKIKVYTGQTSLLSASDMLGDDYLGITLLKGSGYNPIGLTRVVFALDELAASELGPFDVPKPRLYENIGPATDVLKRIMVIVRAVKVVKAHEPVSIDQTVDKSSLKLDEDTDENFYSVREAVVEDLKKLAAMDTTKNRAEEFIELAEKDGWSSAVDKFNNLYRQSDTQSEEDPNIFELQSWTGLQRRSALDLEMVALQSEGNPARQLLVGRAETENKLINRFYSLIPQNSVTIDTLPLVIEFKPDMSYYCLKSLSVKCLDRQQYDKIKAAQDYQEDLIQSQSLAVVLFNPENILKRMKFRLVEEDKEQADINTPAEPQGGL